MEKHSTSRLIGSPPGYVGYEEGGQLTDKVRTKPYTVVLFDEVEKAHPEVFNILLQVLEDGRLTDGKGRTVSFKNTIIIMTSNVGASSIKKASLGFTLKDSSKDEYETMKKNIMEELKKTFKPEFLNRVDDVIVFNSLKKEQLIAIVKIMVKDLQKRLKEQNINIEFTDKALELLVKKGFDENYGARPLRRMIQKHVEDKLSEALLRDEIKQDDNVILDVANEELILKKKE